MPLKYYGNGIVIISVRESSFNLTRGRRDEVIEGALRIFRHPKGRL